jgi:hypothetical protein
MSGLWQTENPVVDCRDIIDKKRERNYKFERLAQFSHSMES